MMSAWQFDAQLPPTVRKVFSAVAADADVNYIGQLELHDPCYQDFVLRL